VVAIADSARGVWLERPRGLMGPPVDEGDQRLIHPDHLAAMVAAQTCRSSVAHVGGEPELRGAGRMLDAWL
jgi:hypothetical protein